MVIDYKKREAKLADLIEIEGAVEDILCEEALLKGVSAGICMNDGCDYTTNVEPDCEEGWCEHCSTNTVVSALELALF